MVRIDHFVLHTVKYQDFINITEHIETIVEGSGVHEGVAFAITPHTTSGTLAT